MHREFVAAVRSAGAIGLATPWGAVDSGTIRTTHKGAGLRVKIRHILAVKRPDFLNLLFKF